MERYRVYASADADRTIKPMRVRPHGYRTRGPLVAIAGGLLSACGSSVFVEADFPEPLVETLPVRMGLILDPELTDYVHYEEIPRQATYTIQIGDANALMMDALFGSMFTAVEPLDELPPASGDGESLDGVLRPQLERFEFDVPIGEKDEFVEVWMQYLVRLYDTDGELVTEWPVSGYGKAELGRRDEALNRATVVAMREVGAVISTKFIEQPEVQYWLQERENATALSAEAPVD